MKKINFQEAMFSYALDALLSEIHAESSYIASSLYSIATEKQSVLPLIISQDERDFVSMNLHEAHNLIASRLAAYLSDATGIAREYYNIELLLPENRPSTIDSLISHEINRCLVSFVLAKWYENRLPDIATRQYQVFNASLAALFHDTIMARRGCKKPLNYT